MVVPAGIGHMGRSGEYFGTVQ
nr:hypothetical protein [Tanacetum cinerariifolium]